MKKDLRVLLVFLDGVGLGVRDPRRNPFFRASLPFLTSLLGSLPSLRDSRRDLGSVQCLPLRTTMGVQGLPQSGTGQTALYAGVNSARLIGQHFGPYLYSTLKPVLARENLFTKIQEMLGPGNTCALANAFPQKFFDYMNGPRKRIVAGIFAASEAGIPFRDVRDLVAGRGVSTDITGQRWKDIGHPEVHPILPWEAGARLAGIANQARFTLFEYFATDKAGHERNMDVAVDILQELDSFFHGVVEHLGSDCQLLITSDHGNLEDLSTKSHTRNPVPLLLFGPLSSSLASELRSIEQVAPSILHHLSSLAQEDALVPSVWDCMTRGSTVI